MRKNTLLIIIFFVFSFSFSQTIGLEQFAVGFNNPVEIAHPPNDSRLFVLEQDGLIKILNSDGTVNSTPFLDISNLVMDVLFGEEGLLGLAFHPDYANNGYFYVNYYNNSEQTIIARYSVSSNPDVANTSETILMTINQPYPNHNGGTLKFGPDGYLYIGMGDGGSAADSDNLAQNLVFSPTNPTRVLLGKMLRIDVNNPTGGLNYGVPATNPFINQTGKKEIWAYGFRNPWKFSFNRLNGDLWIADVGEGAIEEINKIVNPLTSGLNFGWRCYEGNSTFNTSGCAPSSTMTFPYAQYQRTGGACAIIGGYLYTGTVYPNFQNNYFFTDLCDSKIRTINSNGVITATSPFLGNNFSTMGEDKDGELYVASYLSGVVYKIIDESFANSEFEKNGFSIYPNPATDVFFIKSSTNSIAKKVEVYDLTGKLLISKQLETSIENSISISVLEKGMYIITIETNDKNFYTTKLIIE